MSDRLKIKDYKVLSLIGEGGFGKCYKVQQIHSQEVYVWKAIRFAKLSKHDKERIVSEVNLLRELDHPNIVRYYGHLINKQISTLYIIMEYCQGGDLGSLIKECIKQGEQLTEGFIWHILYQTGRAVQACHSLLANKTVIHRDIKPANVFLDSKSNVKLGDFGLACILDRGVELSQSYVGTPYYMSPEVVFGEKYTKKSDVWSLGCLIYQMCSLTPPFQGTSFNELAVNIRAGKQSRISIQYTDDLQNIVCELLTVQQERRPSLENIMQHPIVVTNIINNTFDTVGRISCKHHTSTIQVKRPTDIKENSEFQRELVIRLEGLKLRESLLREKELAIEERERALQKREKEVTLLGKLTRETMSRANVYLHQCRDSRSISSGEKNSAKRCSILEPNVANMDTSLSADPGDTSILPTSCKIKPSHVTRPSKFVPPSQRHVRFSYPQVEKSEGSKPTKYHQGSGTMNKQRMLRDSSTSVQRRDIGGAETPDPTITDNLRNDVLARFDLHSMERAKWLESKRQAFSILNVAQNSGVRSNKENVINTWEHPRKSSIKKKVGTNSTELKPLPYASTGHFR